MPTAERVIPENNPSRSVTRCRSFSRPQPYYFHPWSRLSPAFQGHLETPRDDGEAHLPRGVDPKKPRSERRAERRTSAKKTGNPPPAATQSYRTSRAVEDVFPGRGFCPSVRGRPTDNNRCTIERTISSCQRGAVDIVGGGHKPVQALLLSGPVTSSGYHDEYAITTICHLHCGGTFTPDVLLACPNQLSTREQNSERLDLQAYPIQVDGPNPDSEPLMKWFNARRIAAGLKAAAETGPSIFQPVHGILVSCCL